ncbi:hypothetical protein FGO68_gene14988 [Halteria grandinella]|uniref:Uncharacterized protein n=1 Tax=Halteria grandinella TaxID=5974 RepID=A0A8J8NZ91_HALGN|nr:hypothetical protein FGO68_gene14988 [Halteria grandinella]
MPTENISFLLIKQLFPLFIASALLSVVCAQNATNSSYLMPSLRTYTLPVENSPVGDDRNCKQLAQPEYTGKNDNYYNFSFILRGKILHNAEGKPCRNHN